MPKIVKKIKAVVNAKANKLALEAKIARIKVAPDRRLDDLSGQQRRFFDFNIAYLANWTKYTHDIDWKDSEINWQNPTPFQTIFYNNKHKLPKFVQSIKDLAKLVEKRMSVEAERAELINKMEVIKRGSQLSNYELYYSARKSPALIEAQAAINTLFSMSEALNQKIVEKNADIEDMREAAVNDFMRAAKATPITRLDFLYQYYDAQTAELLNFLRLHKISAEDYLLAQEVIRTVRLSFPSTTLPVHQSLPLVVAKLQALKHLSPIKEVHFDGVIRRLTNNLEVLGKQLNKEVAQQQKEVLNTQKHFRVKYTSDNDNLYTLLRLSIGSVNNVIAALKAHSHYLIGADFRDNQRRIEDWQLFRYQLEHALYKSTSPQYLVGFNKVIFRQQLNLLADSASPLNFKDKQFMKSMLTDLIASSKMPAKVDTHDTFVVPREDAETLIALHNIRMHLITTKQFETFINDEFKQLDIGAKSPFHKDMKLLASTFTSLMTYAVNRAHLLQSELTKKMDEVTAINSNPKTAKQVTLETEIARLRTDIAKNNSNIDDYAHMVQLLRSAVTIAHLALVKTPNRSDISASAREKIVKIAMMTVITSGKEALNTDKRVLIGLFGQINRMLEVDQAPKKRHLPTLYGKRADAAAVGQPVAPIKGHKK